MYFFKKNFAQNLIVLFLSGLAFSGTLAAKELVVLQVGDYSASKAATGKAWRQGTQIAIAQVNAAGGIHGNKVRLVTLDDQYNAEKTVPLLLEAIPREQPIMMVGVRGTPNASEVIKQKVLEKFDMPLVGIYTGADNLRTPTHPYIFHTRASYGEEIEKMVLNFSSTGIKRIALITEKSGFGKSISEGFALAVAKHNVKAVGVIEVITTGKDFSKEVEKIKSLNPNGLVIGTSGGTTAVLLKSLRKANLEIPMTMLSINDVPEIIKAAGKENLQGLAQVQVMPDPASCRVALCRDFMGAYRKFGDAAIPPSPAMVEGFVSGKVAMTALQRAGSQPTRHSVLTALNAMNNLELGGFSIRYDASHHNGSSYMDIGVMNKNGRVLY